MSYDNVAFELDLSDLDPQLAETIDNGKMKRLFVGLANTARLLSDDDPSAHIGPFATPSHVAVSPCLWEASELRFILNSRFVEPFGGASEHRTDVVQPRCVYENGKQSVQLLDEKGNVLTHDIGEYHRDVTAINIGLVAGALLADS